MTWRIRLAWRWLMDDDESAELLALAALKTCSDAQLAAELKRRRRCAQRLANR